MSIGRRMDGTTPESSKPGNSRSPRPTARLLLLAPLLSAVCGAGCGGDGGLSAAELMERNEYFNHAIQAEREHRQWEAIRAVEQSLAIDPEFSLGRKLLGVLYLQSSAFEQARQEFAKVLEREPRDYFARFHLGRVLMAPGNTLDPEGAEREFREALRVEPENAQPWLHLGMLHLQEGRFDRSLPLFEKALSSDAVRAVAWLLTGTAHLRKALSGAGADALDEAIAAFRHSLDQQYDDPVAEWCLSLAVRLKEGTYPASLEERYQLRLRPEGAPPLSFALTDVAERLGVARVDGGRGSAWADVDGDGDLDLAAVGSHAENGLYLQVSDGTFVERGAEWGIGEPGGAWGCLFADYDNDGDADLLLTGLGWFGESRNHLYRNEGDRFADVTESCGLTDVRSSLGASFGDYDRDGDLDLYVANGVGATGPEGATNALYRNDGGTFHEVGQAAGVAHRGAAIGCTFGDFDGDGFPDLYVSNLGRANVLYRNLGDGRFRDVTGKAGVQDPVASYVTFFLDYDRDGDLDLYVSNFAEFDAFVRCRESGRSQNGLERPRLYRNEGAGAFEDVTVEARLDKAFGAMGGNTGDLDNDGYPEILLGTGGPPMERLEPNALFLNLGTGVFAEVTEASGFGHLGKGHGVSVADYDDDGDLDVYVPLGGAYRGDQWPNALYRNDGGDLGDWLRVRLEGVESNRDAVGARVWVRREGFEVMQELNGGQGFGSLNDGHHLHFGLGAGAGPVGVRIRWPSGHVEEHEGITTRRRLLVIEGGGLGSIGRSRARRTENREARR